MPTVRNNAVKGGDHYITVIVDVPKRLTNEQKEALIAYDKSTYRRRKTYKEKGFFK